MFRDVTQNESARAAAQRLHQGGRIPLGSGTPSRAGTTFRLEVSEKVAVKVEGSSELHSRHFHSTQ